MSLRPALSLFDSPEGAATLPQHVWLLDASLKPLQVDARLLQASGLTLEELQASRWTFALHPEDVAAVEAAFTRAAAAPEAAVSMDYRWRQADGRYRWVFAQARRLPGESQCWLGTHTDVDTRKRAEAALLESDSLWKLALESSGDGVWDWYVQDGVELLSPGCLRIYGYEPQDLQPRPEELDSRTHPDDVPQMQRDREAHFSGQTPVYRNEHRIRCKDGSWKWVLSRGMVISRDAQGRPLRMVGTHADITQRKQQEALILQQAHYDGLTGLPNRTLMRERLDAELRARALAPRPMAVLFVDLDQFKEVNDALGHDMGDALLRQAAVRIRDCLGVSDLVARMGGDEFTVLLVDTIDRGAAEQVAMRLIETLAQAFTLGQERVFVSASIGISLYPEDGDGIESLFKHADQALYVAKGTGRNRHCHFTPELQQAAQRRLRLATDLRSALAQAQLQLVYQPIVSLADGSVRKAEALLRWQHPQLGWISPAQFVPIAESTGLILEIGAWVFQQAQQQAAEWRRELRPDFQVSVNTSPVEFRGAAQARAPGAHPAAGAMKWLQACLHTDAIALEITEGLLLDADPAIAQQLGNLRLAGIQLSLDDFGTGYSSLSYLQQHTIDVIKIDQSFVRGLGPGTTSLSLCKAIITMAHELGIRVVAEGVENELQHSLLQRAGCDEGQGYWFARPLSPQALGDWWRQRQA